jgi:hypothetical protein
MAGVRGTLYGMSKEFIWLMETVFDLERRALLLTQSLNEGVFLSVYPLGRLRLH